MSARDDTICAVATPPGVGGIGIHLVKRLSDEMIYRRMKNCNIITLKKKLP